MSDWDPAEIEFIEGAEKRFAEEEVRPYLEAWEEAGEFPRKLYGQIFGGMGFIRGTSSERLYRAVKVLTIGGGTEEIMKELAARQMGF
jgi:hypothetical protein